MPAPHSNSSPVGVLGQTTHTPWVCFLYWVLRVDQMTHRILWSLQMRSPVVTPQLGWSPEEQE